MVQNIGINRKNNQFWLFWIIFFRLESIGNDSKYRNKQKKSKFDDLKYFDFYFDRPIYSGKTLTYYLSSKTCLFFPILKIILDAKFTPQQLNSMIKEADATLI